MAILRTCFLSIACGAAAINSAAQDSQQQAQEERKDLLGGPEVKEVGEASPLPPDFSGSNQRVAANISAEVWMRVLRGLELMEEQRAAIAEIEQEVRSAMMEFRAAYGEELREIERARREAAAKSQRPPQELQLRYAEINKHAPSPVAAQEKIWALLTDDQQMAMSARLEEIQQRMLEERRRRAAGQEDSDQPMEPMTMQETPQTEERTSADEGIDEAGQRRLRFLRSRQFSRPPGAPPSDRERDFRFEDNR